jgi:hypothetical protein
MKIWTEKTYIYKQWMIKGQIKILYPALTSFEFYMAI